MAKMQLFTKNFICTFNFRLFYKHRINLEEKGEECIGHLISYIFEERAGGEVKKMEIMVLYVILNETQSLLPPYLSKKKKKKTLYFGKQNYQISIFVSIPIIIFFSFLCPNAKISGLAWFL